MRWTDRLVLLVGVACLDLPFAALMRVGAPDEDLALAVGLCALTAMGALAIVLALRARARGGWVIALAAPASLAAAWCTAASFALQGGMHFVRLWGSSSRGTDPDWIKALSVVALAHAAVAGPALALVLRARTQTLERPSVDGPDRAASWAVGVAAVIAAATTATLGKAGGAVTASCALALLVLSFRAARHAAFARGLGRDTTFLGPPAPGVLPLVFGVPIDAAAWAPSPGTPYRTMGAEGATPIALVSKELRRTVRPLHVRAGATLGVALASSAAALLLLAR